jgi:outer membrane protein OmpA-like peptidoglycan-associated protein
MKKYFILFFAIATGVWAMSAAPATAPVSQTSSPEKTLTSIKKLPAMARTRIKRGDEAITKEAYADAYDKYLRALSFTKDASLQPLIYYKIGQSQLLLNHHKNAYDYFSMVWNKGYRDFQFLKEYAGVLLTVGRLDDFDKVIEAIRITGVKDTFVNVLEESAELVRANRNNHDISPISMNDVYPLSAINTPFSDYGVGLLNDRMVFSSSRFISGTKMEIDPGTGQAYSRLFYATYDGSQKTWANPTQLQGQFPTEGNIGTFSFDSKRNIAYFMLGMENKNGIYTVQQTGGNNWSNLTEFQFNYTVGGTVFGGNVGHPSISPDGNVLLFTVKDVNRGTGTDIWIVERVAQGSKGTRRVTKVSTPKQAAKNAQKVTPKIIKPKKGEKANPQVIVDKDWGQPYRFGSLVNTPQTESFPQWLDNHTFVYSSNGKVGFGGLDMYMVKLEKDYKTVKSVEHLPAPINSSYDDHGLVYDKNRRNVIFSSNRPTKYGITDNLYLFDKAGVIIQLSGTVYDSLTGAILAPYTIMFGNDTVQPDYQGGYSVNGLLAGIYVLTAVSDGYISKTDTLYLDSVSSVLPVIVKEKKIFYLVKEDVVRKSTFITREQPQSDVKAKAANKKSKDIDISDVKISGSVAYGEPAVYNEPPVVYGEPAVYGEPVVSGELVYDDSVHYDSMYSDVVYSESQSETVEQSTTYELQQSEQLPAQQPEVVEKFADEQSQENPFDEPSATQSSAQVHKGIRNPNQLPVKQPVARQDLTQYVNDDMSAKQVVDAITSNREDISTADQRAVDDYKKRVNDPIRRSRLRVLPANAECEACSEKIKRRNVGEPFYVSAGDDKTLITLINNAGQRTYIDLTPNTNYGIDVTMIDSKGDMSSLPKNVNISDVRKTIITKDYIVYECAPKLSEINDETYVNNLYFDFNGDSLIKDAARELDRMIIVALKNPQIQVEVSAYADERGSDEYNKNLTDRRLNQALSYLERKGFDTDRIKGKSYGKSSPLIVNASTEDEHRLNRRVTFKLIFPFAKNVKAGDATYQVSEEPLIAKEGLIFRVQLGAFKVPLDNPLDYYRDVLDIDPAYEISYYIDEDGLYRYNVGGDYENLDTAREIVGKLITGGRECYVAAFYNGNRITVKEATIIMNRKQ